MIDYYLLGIVVELPLVFEEDIVVPSIQGCIWVCKVKIASDVHASNLCWPFFLYKCFSKNLD